MLNHIRGTTTKITDLQPGSVSRTLVEAPAVEIEQLYLQMFNGLREAIPVATFRSFGFDKLPAKYARGFVSVSNATAPTADLTVPAGTVFTAYDGRTYASTEAVIWLAGYHSIRIPVIAAGPGVSYNIASGSITSSPFFDATYTVSNSAIASGSDVETDAEREARFATFVGSLSRGTIYACRAAARSATILDADGNIQEYVTRVGHTEIAGYVRIYIYSSAGAPSSALVKRAQLLIDGWKDPITGEITPGYRAGGVNYVISAMAEREIPLTAKVAMQGDYVLTDAVIQSLSDEYATQLVKVEPGAVLYMDDVVTGLLSVPGLKTVTVDAEDNIICDQNEALVPGAIKVTPL